MKIEVGKKYRRRDGVEVTITRDDGDSRDCCFWGDDGGCYGEGGSGSRGDLIEEIVNDPQGEIIIEPGALVLPHQLAVAREMSRNGEEFFFTAKSNGTEKGFITAIDKDFIWDDSNFYVRRGPLDSWLIDDPQGEIELHDGGEIVEPESLRLEVGKKYRDRTDVVWECVSELPDHDAYDFECVVCDKFGETVDSDEFCSDGSYWSHSEESDFDLIEEVVEPVTECRDIATSADESQQVTIEPGEEFTTADVDKVEAARRLQADGVRFEIDISNHNTGTWYSGELPYMFNDPPDSVYRRKPEPLDADDVMCEPVDADKSQIDFIVVGTEEEESELSEVRYTLTGTELRRDILRQVESCVCANRQNTYGDAEDNFANIAAIANVALQNKLSAPLEPEDVAIFSVCIKLARLIQSPEHLDNWIDGAGYLACGGGIMKRKELNAKATEADAAV